MSIYRGKNKKEFYLSSLLYDAIDDRDFSSVKSLLVEKNADPNIVLPKKGISPFHLIIGCDSNDFAVKITRLILQYGGNPNVKSDDRLTPVHIAAAWGRTEILSLLLASGGDPEARDANYMTPFHYARKEDFVECLELLRSYLPVKNEILTKEKEDCQKYNLKLDKVLVNNGRIIGVYEILNEYQSDSITEEYLRNLKSLPQSDTTEYVMNWFKNHIPEQSGHSFINLPKSTESNTNTNSFLSCESSVDESDNERAKSINIEDITFRKCYKKTRKVNKAVKANKVECVEIDSNKIMSNKNDKSLDPDVSTYEVQDFSKIKQFSKESGIVTLSDSFNDESELLTDKFGTSNTKEQISLTKPQEISSDYMTCSSNSLFEKNVFEITDDISVNVTDDNSKNTQVSELNNAKCEENFNNDISTVSISEVYKYVDMEEGIVLYERRLLKSTSDYNGSIKSSSFSSKVSTLPETIDYDSDTLRKELTVRGFNPGPITVTTKRIYLKKLHQLKKYPALTNEEYNLGSKRVYSVELEKTLRDLNWYKDLTFYKTLDETVSKQFSNPDPSRKWREGVSKSSFTYLLLDPRRTNNLPGRAEVLEEKEVWETFLSSIFYVGKGKRSRPYSHLYEALTAWNKDKLTATNKKIQNIMEIWNSNCGVICLHLFQNIIPAEAYTREAAMISALNINNLTNAKSGDFYGTAATWPQKHKKMYGVYLLYRAMKIFINEGERQLCPSDID